MRHSAQHRNVQEDTTGGTTTSDLLPTSRGGFDPQKPKNTCLARLGSRAHLHLTTFAVVFWKLTQRLTNLK